MSASFLYPQYDLELTCEKMTSCMVIAQHLLEDVGLKVRHEKFRNSISRHNGVKIANERIFLSRGLTGKIFNEYLNHKRIEIQKNNLLLMLGRYVVVVSLVVIDIETDNR